MVNRFFPAWDGDGGSDDPVLFPAAADLRHDRPGADEFLVVPLLDADAAGAVRPLHPHRVRTGAVGDEKLSNGDFINDNSFFCYHHFCFV